jgi:hypothetical protein
MNDVLILSLSTISSAIVMLIVRYSYRSKCSDIDLLWGCLKVKRDVAGEENEDVNGINPVKSNENINVNLKV